MLLHSHIELGTWSSAAWRRRILAAQRTAKRRRNLIGHTGLMVVGATVLVWQLVSEISAQRGEERVADRAAGCEITPDWTPTRGSITPCSPPPLYSGGVTLDLDHTDWLSLLDRPARHPATGCRALINPKTARALGLAVPPALLACANRVIE